MKNKTLHTLLGTPPSDINFKAALGDALPADLAAAEKEFSAKADKKTALAAVQAEVRRRQKAGQDLDSNEGMLSGDWATLTDTINSRVVAEHAKGLTVQEIEDETGLPRKVILAVMKENGLTPKSAAAKAEVIDITPAQPLATVPEATPDNDAWGRAKRFVEAATLFQRASLAAQIMAGIELAALKKQWGVMAGRHSSKTLLPHDVGGALPWPKAVQEHLGISDQTAYRWMEMAKEAQKRLEKDDLNLGAILEKNPGALTAPEQELLKKAVHRISDGKTQMEFMLDCGVTKPTTIRLANGQEVPANRHGELPANIDPATGKRLHYAPQGTPAEQAAAVLAQRKKNFVEAFQALFGTVEKGDFGVLSDDDAELYYGSLRDLTEKLLNEVIIPRRRAAKDAAAKARRTGHGGIAALA